MGRIRFNHNSFGTGFISKKVAGNVDFEGYNNALQECTNFVIQHTGGCFKRGGTEFISHTKQGKAKLIPFYISNAESYICEFGDGYIRFFTKNGALRDDAGNIYELDTSQYFNFKDVETGTYFQNGNIMTWIFKSGSYTITRESATTFAVAKTPYSFPPLTATNYDDEKNVTVTVNGDNISVIAEKEVFYATDENEVLCLTKRINAEDIRYYFKITRFVDSRHIDISWSNSWNLIDKPADLAGDYTRWQISRFTKDRTSEPELEHFGVALYEGRMFLAANDMIWGSSLEQGDLLNFKTGADDSDGVVFSISEIKSDDILWMIGQSKLFLATASGLYMGGAAIYNDDPITPRNFRVRLFESIGVSPLKPVAAVSSIFFTDSSTRNVHEIVLSMETGAYQSNDLSLLGNDLTQSGIVAHTWQQTPIKTYWCAVKDGHLCSLTYLKNNGIMAWAKHTISGNNVAIESLAVQTYGEKDYLWMIVKRQVNGEIVRFIEYMHPIYDPIEQEEFKQFFVDSGKSKSLKHTITGIKNGSNYSFTCPIDIRALVGVADANELKVIFLAKIPLAEPLALFQYEELVAKNFDSKGLSFELFESFDNLQKLPAYIGGGFNTSIKTGKIDPDKFSANEQAIMDAGVSPDLYVKATSIERVENSDLGKHYTKIFCKTGGLANGDRIIFKNSTLQDQLGRDLNLSNINVNRSFIVSDCHPDYFMLKEDLRDGNVPVDLTTAGIDSTGEIYKLAWVGGAIRDYTFKAGLNAVVTVDGDLGMDVNDVRNKSGNDVYINKVYGMTEVNGIRYKQKSGVYNNQTNQTDVTLYDYTQSPVLDNPDYLVPLDAQRFSIYDIDITSNGNLYEFFSRMEDLDHLEGQEVSICSNGNTYPSQKVTRHVEPNGDVWYGFDLDSPSMYCVAGLKVKSVMKTVPFSGGNALGSSVGVVGQQIHSVFNLYHSLGGRYGTEIGRTYPFQYPPPQQKPFNQPKQLFSGLQKLPLINSREIYERCILIEHEEPVSFNLLAITHEVSVSDA